MSVDDTAASRGPDRGGRSLVGHLVDGRYQVERIIGEGGMGLVYRATHIRLGKAVALKVLRSDVSSDEAIVARFQQEAQSASAIGHPHIVEVFDFGTLPDRSAYFVMESLEGCTLAEAIRTGMSYGRLVHIAQQLADALGAAHAVGIVHRDLKPDNVYLVNRSEDPDFVKVLDFGIAKVLGTASRLTGSGQIFGTPHYMSPEQASGRPVDHRSDVYQLGVMLYEMVAGHVPFHGDNPLGILAQHMTVPPTPLSQLRPDVPDPLEAIVLRCMEKDPATRFATMRELRDSLRRLPVTVPPGVLLSSPQLAIDPSTPTLAQVPTPDAPLALGAFPSLGPATPPRATPTPERDAGAVRGARRALAIGLGLVLGLLGAAAFGFAFGRPAAPPTEPPPAPPAMAAQGSTVAGEPVRPVARVVRLSLRSSPPGAMVRIGERTYGPTPADVELAGLPPGTELTLDFEHAGFRPLRVTRLVRDEDVLEVAATLETETAESMPEPARRRPRAFRDSPY